MGLLQDAVILQLSIGLALGVPMILAGLQLFKLWLAIVGFFTGVFLGIILGGVNATVLGLRGDEFYVAVALMALISGITGAILAWPLQRLFVFVAAGGLAAITALALASLLGIGGEVVLALGLIAFFGGGALSVWAYEYFIIISLASGGAKSLFHAYVGRFDAFQGTGPLDHLLGTISTYLWQYLLIIVSSVLFGIYLQKWSQPSANVGTQARIKSSILRRYAFLLGGLLVASYLAQVIFPEALEVTMLGPLAWMAMVLLLPPLVYLTEEVSERTGLPVPAARYALFASIAVLIFPALAWAQDLILYGGALNPLIYVSHGFTDGMGTLKAVYAFVLFPTLGMMVMPGSVLGASSKGASSSGASPRPSPTTKSAVVSKGPTTAPEASPAGLQPEVSPPGPQMQSTGSVDREPDEKIPAKVSAAMPPALALGQAQVPSGSKPHNSEVERTNDLRPFNPTEHQPLGKGDKPRGSSPHPRPAVGQPARSSFGPSIVDWPEWSEDSEGMPRRLGAISKPPKSQPEPMTTSPQKGRRERLKETPPRRLEWPE